VGAATSIILPSDDCCSRSNGEDTHGIDGAAPGSGLKATPQRLWIFRILHDNAPHPTAHSVFQSAWAEMPTISLRTVSQTLSDMGGLGEIQQSDVGTGAAASNPRRAPSITWCAPGAGRCATSRATSPACASRRRQHQGSTISDAEVDFRACAPGVHK
jgi:hypothetical protein